MARTGERPVTLRRASKMARQPDRPEGSARWQSVLKLSFHCMAAGDAVLRTSDSLCTTKLYGSTLRRGDKPIYPFAPFKFESCRHDNSLQRPFQTAPADARV
jgi:hypothetical protein